ncbi:MAG: SRPBCC family protein [Flavobacteriales bacterium]|nr:SRPBCC family protein [Flavobacteriales bacterium]
MSSRLIKVFFALVAVSALVFAGFFAIGVMRPSVPISARIEIERPVADVFAAYNAPFDRMDWLEGYEGTERVSGGAGIPGSVSTVFFTHDGKKFVMKEELKDYVENRLVELTWSNEVLTQRMRVAFEAVDEQSASVTMSGTVEGTSWFMRSMMGLAQNRMQQQEEQNFVRLKELLEM